MNALCYFQIEKNACKEIVRLLKEEQKIAQTQTVSFKATIADSTASPKKKKLLTQLDSLSSLDVSCFAMTKTNLKANSEIGGQGTGERSSCPKTMKFGLHWERDLDSRKQVV